MVMGGFDGSCHILTQIYLGGADRLNSNSHPPQSCHWCADDLG